VQITQAKSAIVDFAQIKCFDGTRIFQLDDDPDLFGFCLFEWIAVL
jgi:hypothetical protein